MDSFKRKHCPVLDVKVFRHEGRYCLDIMIESLFGERTVSWVRIVNGINKYVTETSEKTHTDADLFTGTGRLVAKEETDIDLLTSTGGPVATSTGG